MRYTWCVAALLSVACLCACGALHAPMLGCLITIVAASLVATRIRAAAKASAFADASADKSVGEPTESVSEAQQVGEILLWNKE